jgi:hypothetical protein
MRRCAVLAILMYLKYIPVAVLRAPCLVPARYAFWLIRGKLKRQQKSRLSTAFLLCCSAPYKTADGIFIKKNAVRAICLIT